MACAVPTEAQRETRDNLNKLKDLFDGHTIRDIDGKARGVGNIIRETYKPTTEDFGNRMFAEIVWKSTYKPADEAYTDFTKGDYRRIANEIQKEAKRLNDPKLNWLEKVGFVKRGVMGKFAVTRWMNKHINLVTNYERTKFSVYLSKNTAISQHIRAEVIKRHPELAQQLLAKLTPGIKDSNTLDKFERNLIYEEQNLRAIKDPDQRAKKRVEINTLKDQIAEVLESDGGKILKEVVDYLEATPVEVTDYRGRKSTVKLNKEGQRFATNIELAGEDARALLNDMGGVLMNGIDNHIKAIKLAFNKIPSPRLKAYENHMIDQRKGIKEGIEKGDYFPHFLTDSMMNIEKIVDKIEFSDSRDIQEGYLGELENTWSAMRQSINSVPGAAKDRSKFQYDNWIKNPLTVLRKYSMDAISFNRTNRLKSVYMEGIKRLPKDAKIARELNDYINDVFTLAGRGYRDRPVWVNKAVRVLTGYEFLSKIGFGVATAARNTMSAMYYIQSVGNLSFMRYMRDWNKSGKEHDDVREIMGRIELEQGFRFEDLSNPLFTEGLLPTEGKQISDVDIVLDPQTGVPSLQYKNKKGWQTFDNILTRATGYGAIFQKVTENYIRKHMFRYAFKSKYNELVRGGRLKSKAERDAKLYALDMVNKYAFEYSASQKAPIIGGTTKNLGAIGQVAFQFMHYPMSFLQTQSEILRNSKDAVMAKQWNNPDLVIPIKFAGLYLFTQLMSGVGNVDFNRLMENDTMDRLIDIKDVMEGKEDIKGRGYIGPAIGDLFFLATLKDFIELPDNQVTDMIVGYNNAYKLTDEQKSMRLLSTFNVEMAKVPRNWKALQNGTIWNVMMHEFGLYPKAWTKEMRTKQPLKPLFPDTRRGPGIYTGSPKKKKKKDIGGLESDIELGKLYRAMGI